MGRPLEERIEELLDRLPRAVDHLGVAAPIGVAEHVGVHADAHAWRVLGHQDGGDPLGARPAAGRLLVEDDLPDRPGGAVVIAHDFWQNDLGAREDVVGSTIVLDEVPHTVVGVLAPEFRAPRLESIRVWAPLHFDPRAEDRRDWRGFLAYGRLRPGVTVDRVVAGEPVEVRLEGAQTDRSAIAKAVERAGYQPVFAD